MADKKDNKAPRQASSTRNEEEKRLLEKHPFETMSQVQNRYGKGRERSGSDGTKHDARGSNH